MAHTRYMITKTATSDQCSHEFHSCQPTIPSAMNGSAVIVPVAIRSAVSFLTGCTSSRVGLGGSTTSWCVVKSFMLLASLAPRWPCRTLPKEAESRITPATVRPVGGAVAHEVLVSGGSCDLGQLNLPDSQRPSSGGRRQERYEQEVLCRSRRFAGGRAHTHRTRVAIPVPRTGVRNPGRARRPRRARQVPDGLGQDAGARCPARRSDRRVGRARRG